MSSIIDALKKSDAKRPKKNPGLKIRMDLKSQTKKRKRWVFYAIVMALMLILVAVYLQKPDYVWQHLGAAEQAAVTTNNPPKEVKTAKPTNKLKKPTPQQVQSAAKKQPAQKPVTETQTPQTKDPETLKPPTDVATIADDKVLQTNNIDDKTQSRDKPIESQVQQEIDQQLAATPMKNKQAIKAPVKDNQQQAQAEPNLPQLYELPYAIRKDLPKLNLSVHVYDPVVENRMAIINGVPIHVGDTFEDLISIQDITQSGVILRIQGKDFIVLK